MGKLTFERTGDALKISGNVDRSVESELSEALEGYVKEVAFPNQIVDMSDVAYFASSTARVLIGVAQDVLAQGGKLKIRSSKPVAQTLNLLGAKSWVDIEIVAKDPVAAAAAAAAQAPSPAENQTAARGRVHEGSVASYRPEIHRSAPAQAPAKPVATAPVTSASILGSRPEALRTDTSMDEAKAVAGQPLVDPSSNLSADLAILNEMIVLDTYTFHFADRDMDLTAKVLKYLGGAWVLTDSKGTRRMVNLNMVTFIDRLS